MHGMTRFTKLSVALIVGLGLMGACDDHNRHTRDHDDDHHRRDHDRHHDHDRDHHDRHDHRRVEVEEREYPVQEEQVVIVQEAPPPIIVEHHSAPPAPDFIWVDGYWSHNKTKYVWVPGRHVRRHPGERCVAAHWERSPRGWEFRREHWEKH